MTTAGAVSVDFEANTARFVAEVGKVRQAVQETQQATTQSLGLMRSAFAIAGAGAAGFIGALSVRELYEFGVRAVQTVGNLQDLSGQLGLSTRALQIYGYAAGQANVSQGQFEAAMIRFNDTIGSAAQGNARAIQSFQQLGIRILDAHGALRPTETLLHEVADALAAVEDPARRAALANDLFGRAGARLLPLLEGGSAGLRRMAEEAGRLGIVIDDQTIRAADELTKEWDRNQRAMEAWSRTLGVRVMNYIQDAVRGLDALRLSLQRLFAPTPTQAASDQIGTLRNQIAAIDSEIESITTPGPNQPRGAAIPGRLAMLRAQRAALLPQIEAAEARYAATAPSEYTDLPPGPRSITVGGGVANPDAAQRGRAGRAEQVDREAQAYERLARAIDPAYRAQQDYLDGTRLLDEMQQRGSITEAEYDTRLRQITERYEGARAQAMGWSKALQGNQDTMRDVNQAARDLGLTFTSAFENAVIKGESLRAVLGGVLSDIGRILVRLAVTNPLANAVQTGLSSLFGPTSRASGGGSYSASAMGNVLGPRGPIALAGGGIVDGPHVALIGEGAMNEAVVPLPDGRSIPVDVRGDRGSSTIMINVDARGAEPGAAARLQAVADQIVARAVAAIPVLARAGGQYARDIGARKR